MLTGRIVKIDRYAVHDGPGIRTAVFFKGCRLQCGWCHSPETQRRAPEVLVHRDRCIVCGTCVAVCPNDAIEIADGASRTRRGQCRACGTCVARCPSGARELAGRRMTVPALMDEIERDVIFFDQSAGGVTCSGGEPLMQPEFLTALLAACRAHRLHTAVETCGFAARAVLADIARHVDLFLYDVKHLDAARHRQATGVSNDLILDNLRFLSAHHPNVRVRVPLIPGVNDDHQHLRALGEFLVSLRLDAIDLLPYHRAGIAKYARLDRPYAMHDVTPPSADTLSAATAVLTAAGLAVHIGGS